MDLWPRLAAIADRPGLSRQAALVAAILVSPALGMGIAADDWLQRAKLLGNVPGIRADRPLFLDVFSFFPRDPDYFRELQLSGVLPWWTDPDVRAAFLRPVTVATHWLDYALWPDTFWLQHAHSILWLVLAVLAAGAFFRAWLGDGRIAALALLAFALDDSHAWPAGWLANRNALVAATLGCAGLALHLRGRTWLAALPLGLSLFSAEMGTGAITTLVGIELFRTDPVATRIRRLVPAGLVSILWAAAWMAGGFGVKNSGLYLDPTARPLQYLAALPERMGVMLATQWLNVPLDFWVMVPPLGATLISAGLFALSAWLVYPVVRPHLATPVGRQAAAAMVLSVLPVAAGFPMDRMVMFVGLGAFALLAMSLALRLDGEVAHPRRLATLAFFHLPLAGLMLVAKATFLGPMLGMLEVATEKLPLEVSLGRRDLVILSGLEVLTAHLPASRRMQGLPVHRRQAVLVPAGTNFTVTRESERVLRVDSEVGLFRGISETLCRDKAMPTSSHFDLGWYTVDVLADIEGHPSSLRYTFDRNLDDPSFLWVTYRAFDLDFVHPPALGATVVEGVFSQ